MDKVSKDQFDYLPPEVLTDEYKTYMNYMTYKPTPFMESTNVEFNGNITLLIDNLVYSAAEGFANFCKEYGFARSMEQPVAVTGSLYFLYTLFFLIVS